MDQTIELKIKSTAQEAKSSVEQLVRSLTNIDNVLTNIYLELGSIEKKSNSSINKASQSVNTLKTSTDKATDSANKLNRALSLGGLFIGTKKLTNQSLSWMKEAIDKTEQLNMFNVVFKNIEKDGEQTFSKLGKEAIKFQNKLNEAFGTNQSTTLQYHALFQSMSENLGVNDKYAYIMSENLTKLTYDWASLYNKTEEEVARALKAGVLAGQTEPLRNFGSDVTQQTLGPVLESLGITDRTVKELSQAEKQILRYIAVLNQSSVAHGDFANTIESPANQLKIFSQQLVEAKSAFSSLFINTFGQALPYLNATLMVVKEISKAIADMFGIKLQDYNNGIVSQEGIYDGIADSVDGASKAVKEFKRQTLGFDEIHNINENNDNASGSGISGGIDQRLLDAIKGYDNGMDKVKMKATEIRDKIMEWLGFTKEIDPLTGEVSFKYQGIKTTLKNMWDSFKKLNTQGKALNIIIAGIMGYKITKKVKDLIPLLGNNGLVKVTKSLISPMSSLFGWMKLGVQVNGNLNTGLKDGIQAWREQNILVTKADGSLNKWKTTMSGAKIAVQGLITGAMGLSVVHESMKNLSTEGANLVNVLGLVGGSFTTIASGVQIGAIFGPWGAVIGGAVGAILSLNSAIDGYETASEKFKSSTDKIINSSQKSLQEISSERNAIDENTKLSLSQIDVHKKLLEELDSLIDANGKIKDGYEDRANVILTVLNEAYGTEYKAVDGIIQQYDELKQSIDNLIKKKQSEIMIETQKEKYINSLKNEGKIVANNKILMEQLEQAQRKLNDAQRELDNFEYTGSFLNDLNRLKKAEDNVKNYTDTINELKNELNELDIEYTQSTMDQIAYGEMLAGALSEDYEMVEQASNTLRNTIVIDGETITTTFSDTLAAASRYSNDYLKKQQEVNGKITEEDKRIANERLNGLITSLIQQSQTVDSMTPEITKAWSALATTNKDAYNQAIVRLPEDVKNHLTMIESSVNQALGYGSNVYHTFGAVGASLGKNLGDSISNNMAINGSTLNSTWNSTITPLYNAASKLSGSVLGFELPALSSLKIPAYANGGIPEDGLFFANHNELVGKFSNGRTAVANNLQIETGIEEAAYRGYMRAIRDSGMNGGLSSEIDVHVHTDEGTVIDRIEQRTKQTGQFPFTIPTY